MRESSMQLMRGWNLASGEFLLALFLAGLREDWQCRPHEFKR